jgi:peptidoglycan/xylan/chitin deacetylase (PgdA/CDA1 family)
VLLYHRIDERTPAHTDVNPDLTTASPQHFERQLQHLAHFYHPVSAAEVLAALAGQHRLPRRAVLVTFDDGYRDFAEVAWPLLKRYHMPVVLFVPSAFVDDPQRMFWSDSLWQMITRTGRQEVLVPGVGQLTVGNPAERLATFRRLIGWLKSSSPAGRSSGLARLAELFNVQVEPTRSVLTWPEVRQLVGDGATMAAHSRTHERLDQLDGEALRSEVEGSRGDLVRELGTCAPLFAYPYGNADAAAVGALAEAGFTLGFTTVCGVSDLGRVHPLLIRRDDGRASMRRFALRMSEPFSLLRTLRHPYPAEMRLVR